MLKEKFENTLPGEDSWLIPRENGMMLSDYQVKVLETNNINYRKYNNYKELLFALNELDMEDEELEEVANSIAEMDYYNK